MSKRSSSALSPIAIANDHDRPLGERLSILRAWRQQIEKEERRLLMQLGCDVAKDLFARGVKPTGRPLAETFREIDEASAGVSGAK